MFKKFYLLLGLSLLLVGCSCSKPVKDNNDNELDSNSPKENVQQIIKLFNERSGELKVDNIYNIYTLKDNILSGSNYNSDIQDVEEDLHVELDNVGFTNGTVLVDQKKKLYIYMENEQVCAKKDFDSDEIEVYDISDKEKCDGTLPDMGQELLYLFASSFDATKVYNSNDIIDEFPIRLISILSVSLDLTDATYKWFRNGVEIESIYGSMIEIEQETENADYYLQVITPDGKKYNSSVFNLKVK